MKTVITLALLLNLIPVQGALAQDGGPADVLWEYYGKGDFEEVIAQGKALLVTGEETAMVNLAVGRSYVDLEKYDEGFPYLTRAVELDTDKTWVYAWAQVYLGVLHFKTGNEQRAAQAWILARDCRATRNATRNAENNLKFLGLSEFFFEWKPFETDHFLFRFSGRLENFDRVEFARSHEEAYEKISAWFGGGPEEKTRFFLWSSGDEAKEAGMPPLGFSRPRANLTHAALGQTLGHEMTHIISHYAINPTVVTGLINEGIAVHMDLTGRDQMKRARGIVEKTVPRPLKVSIPALWLDWTLAPDTFSYPLAGAFVNMLLEKGGKERFLEFFKDQSYSHALEIYGNDLHDWIRDFEEELYQ